MADATKIIIDCDTGEATEVPLTPEEIALRDDAAVAVGNVQAAQAFSMDEDAERLRIIQERAAVDPAYAALAELTLGTKGVQT